MQTDQRKFRQVVIEPHLFTPSVLVVTVFTFLAKLPLMYIVQFMAAITVHF